MNPTQTPSARSARLSDADHADQAEARRLLATAGSDQAQRAVESAVGQKTDTPQRDAFARQWEFHSYLEMFEASKPLVAVDGLHWLATKIAGDQWIVWNEQELGAAYRVQSMEEAEELLGGIRGEQATDKAPPTG